MKQVLEINQSIKIRNENQWKLPEELNRLTQNSWFDPNKNDLKEAKEFYEEHASDALSLCFDEIRKVSATYLGALKIKRDGKSQKSSLNFLLKMVIILSHYLLMVLIISK